MTKKIDPAWRYDVRSVPYDDIKREPLETFIENLKKAGEGLTDPRVEISGHGDSEYGTSWVEVSVSGTRPKTEQELEQERELAEWQRQREAEAKEQRAKAEKTLFLNLYKKYGKPKE